MEEKNKFLGFESAGKPELGMAMIFDVSGFTNFFNKPDLQYYITTYINKLIECIEIGIWGGTEYWTGDNDFLPPLKLKPAMRKFLGDGVLYVWENDEKRTLSNTEFKLDLLNRLWNVQRFFDNINSRLYDEIPIGDLPNSIKIGMAQGTVYKLTERDGTVDFIGPCINLTSRLVKYCKEINFVCSARLDIPRAELEKSGYFKIIAKELRSFENEIVIIDKGDYENVAEVDKKRLFREL